MLTLNQGLLIFLHCPASKDTGSAQKSGGDNTSTATEAGQRDILYFMILCSEINAEGGVCKALIAQGLAERQSKGSQQLGFLFLFTYVKWENQVPDVPLRKPATS